MPKAKPRERYGEGSVYFDPSRERWVATLEVGEGGQRRRKRFFGRTEREARGRRREHGLPTRSAVAERRDVTVGELLTTWLEEDVDARLEPNTARRYRGDVEIHLLPELGRLTWAALEALTVQRLLNRVAREGLSPRSVAHLRGTLRRAINWGQEIGLLDADRRNVATIAKPPSARKRKPLPLPPEDAQVFLDRVEGHPHAHLYRFALLTGMRRSELLALKDSAVAPDLSTASVRGGLKHIPPARGRQSHLELRYTKNPSSWRTVYLASLAQDALRAQLQWRQAARLQAGDRWWRPEASTPAQEDWSDLLFVDEYGRPLKPNTITRNFLALARDLEIPALRHFHDLRHGCTTLMRAAGIPDSTIMAQLGHSQLTMTELYGGITPRLQRSGAELLGQLFEVPMAPQMAHHRARTA